MATTSQPKMKLRRGDTVQVLSGRDAGKRGAITQVFPKLGMVVVEGINVRTKHLKSQSSKKPGQRLTFNAPLASAKVALVDPVTDKPTRLGYQVTAGDNGKVIKTRISRGNKQPV